MNNKIKISAIGDGGKPVDWWFLYKVAGKSKASDGSKPTGTEYVFFDSVTAKGKMLALSPFKIDNTKEGAVSGTLNQIYTNLKNPDLGWFFYNDEPSNNVKQSSSKGHTKGVICFNMATNTGFWMIHSAPKFPLLGKYSFPKTAIGNAQSFLCITLDADTLKAIAGQMIVTQHPNVYAASKIPAAITDKKDPRALLMTKVLNPPVAPYSETVAFKSCGGQYFRCIAKNMKWHKTNEDDFYNDLVGPILSENIDVETWEHDPTPGSRDSDGVHSVYEMKSVDLAPLGLSPSFAWSEENDHAKIAVSAPKENPKYVCVGDINFTIAQENRSGGTVAFICDDLWQSLSEILFAVKFKTSKNRVATRKKTPVKKSGAKKKPVAKKGPVSKKKQAAKKKTEIKKKTAAKKKTATKKKAAVRKSAGKKSIVKKRPAVKKKTAVKKSAVKKSPLLKRTAGKKKTAVKKK